MRYIRIFVSILIILFFTSFELLSIEFSQRTGNTIDSVEAKYFSLFRDYDGFVTAEIIGSDDIADNIKIIYADGKRDTSIKISEAQSKNLKLYIENYELYLHEDIVFDNSKIPEAIQIDQSKIRNFINLDYFFRDLLPVQIELINGDMIENCGLVAVVGDTLILAKERNRYNWRDAQLWIPTKLKYIYFCSIGDESYNLYSDSNDMKNFKERFTGLQFFDHPVSDFKAPLEMDEFRETISGNEIKELEYEADKVRSIKWINKKMKGGYFIEFNYQEMNKWAENEQQYKVENIQHEKITFFFNELKDRESKQYCINLNFGYYYTDNIIFYSGAKFITGSYQEHDECFKDKGWAFSVGTGWDNLPYLDKILQELKFGIKLEANYNFYEFYHKLTSHGKTAWIPNPVTIEDENNHFSFTCKPYVSYYFLENFALNISVIYEYHPFSNYSTTKEVGNYEWRRLLQLADGQKYSAFGFGIGLNFIL